MSKLETILIVDDEGVVLSFVSSILKEKGYTVLEARSASEALQLCRNHDAGIDLLLIDIVMPDMGGGQLARELERLRPGIPVLYMSGYTQYTIHHGVLQSESSFIWKPFAPDELLNKVRELLDHPRQEREAPGAEAP